jgi:hypothetical protein
MNQLLLEAFGYCAAGATALVLAKVINHFTPDTDSLITSRDEAKKCAERLRYGQLLERSEQLLNPDPSRRSNGAYQKLAEGPILSAERPQTSQDLRAQNKAVFGVCPSGYFTGKTLG